MEKIGIIALIIFIITYIGIIFTRLPKMNIDRPSAAFFGAVAMVIFGVLSFNEAILAIDFNTITLLLGMMMIISTLQLDGFFSLIAHKTISFAKNQTKLLILVVFVTGIASAFLVNDAVVLIFTPVIILICKSSKINPIPYLIAEILASNAGSVMSITGNPQNMLIGLNSGISYSNFLFHLFPVSIISMVIIIVIIRWLYPSCFRKKKPLIFQTTNFEYNYASMKTSVPVFIMVVISFFFSNAINLSIPLIALAGGSLILILGKIKPSVIIKQVDWVLLLFFASLFIVVEGIQKTGLLSNLISKYPLTNNLNGIWILHGISFIGSQIVSNVPLTVVLLPFMKAADSSILWLSLASASTLAGNATIIGAMANLIVIETAEKQNVKIKFMDFFKSGIIITIITLLLSVLIIYVEQLIMR
ncbi:MAG TPA: SLC13 family permease [Bacteroidales bacterium]|nr:SLC13 family permease [Bacteroidales bacterium]